jgi:hypothetical protein
MYWAMLSMQTAPPSEWWAETYYRIAAPLEGKTEYSPRRANLRYRGSIANFVRQEVDNALRENWTIEQAGER